ncbi:MAG TPA: glucose 1-dehydrogenase [Bryobacteraceae bacterium]|nr:glucose 1-dehydrogenase [Bryobacteraceae bacterium]
MLKSLDLSGRVAVVIGGTSGLGRAIALGLAEAGADVVATGRREALVQEACEHIERAGRHSLAVVTDVSDRRSVDVLRDRVLESFGQVDILVNAAGRVARRPTLAVSEEEWRDTMDVNTTGALRACQSFYEPLAAFRRGRVINIASLNSFVALTEVAAYAASKSALLSLTRSLAVEWAPSGVNVNAIAPGVFRTDFNRKLLDETERGRELLMRTPMKRFGCAEELIGAAILLASDGASFITGQCIVVDGGFLASGVNS